MARLICLLACATLAWLAITLGAGSAAMAAETCADATMSPAGADLARIRAATLCLLNAERAKHDLPSLRTNGQLAKAAQAYGERMVRQRFFGHVCPDGSTIVSRIRTRTKYLRPSPRSWLVGENLAWDSGSRGAPGAIVRAWMRSAPHRVAILDRRFRDIGVGVVSGAPSAGAPAALTYATEFGYRAMR